MRLRRSELESQGRKLYDRRAEDELSVINDYDKQIAEMESVEAQMLSKL